jgi:hypothetical protein
MYNIEDKNEAVRELQRLLGIRQTGIFDTGTKQSVIEHQRENNLEITGIADYVTFTSITESYRKRKLVKRVHEALPFTPRFPYTAGSMGDDVELINSLLRGAMEKYSINSPKPKGRYYSDYTADAVRQLRHIFILDNGTHIDEIFYDKLLRHSI